MQGVESAAPIQPQSQPQTPVAPATTTTTTAVVSTAKNPASGPFPASTTPKLTPLPHALKSPKVLTECPIAVVLIFQSFRQVMQGAMKDFYPLVMDSIALQPEPQRKAYQAAEEKGQIFTGVADGIHNREMYTEIIKAQVKVRSGRFAAILSLMLTSIYYSYQTMAFLAYVLRGSIDNIRNYLDIFPEACVRLLRDCPPEDVATRKVSAACCLWSVPHIDRLHV
jgi:transformation/transcription domain-associated protein